MNTFMREQLPFLILLVGMAVFTLMILHIVNPDPVVIPVETEIWKQESAEYSTVVHFEDNVFYCEHAEFLAGYSGKIELYRGKSTLRLPDMIIIDSAD